MPEHQYSEIDIYLKLCSMHLLFRYLPKTGKKKFIESLNKNPIRFIAEDDSFKFNSIINFNAYENYFIYKPFDNHEKVYFVKKNDVPKALENTVKLVRNGYITFHSHRLN